MKSVSHQSSQVPTRLAPPHYWMPTYAFLFLTYNQWTATGIDEFYDKRKGPCSHVITSNIHLLLIWSSSSIVTFSNCEAEISFFVHVVGLRLASYNSLYIMLICAVLSDPPWLHSANQSSFSFIIFHLIRFLDASLAFHVLLVLANLEWNLNDQRDFPDLLNYGYV